MDWIPVSERLPKEGETVIAAESDGGVELNWIPYSISVPESQRGKWWFGNTFVTHWMPLPKPPVEVLAPTGNGPTPNPPTPAPPHIVAIIERIREAATPVGEDADGFIVTYDVPAGALHALFALTRNGTPLKPAEWATPDVPYLLTELSALREEVGRLKGVLEKYGGHHLDCEQLKLRGGSECSCGFEAALSPSPAQQEEK